MAYQMNLIVYGITMQDLVINKFNVMLMPHIIQHNVCQINFVYRLLIDSTDGVLMRIFVLPNHLIHMMSCLQSRVKMASQESLIVLQLLKGSLPTFIMMNISWGSLMDYVKVRKNAHLTGNIAE